MVFTSITIINCITEIIVTDYTATLTPVAAPSVLPAENCCINPWAGSLTWKVLSWSAPSTNANASARAP